MTVGSADIRRWSEEVARDPQSLAFLPLARAYRRHGRRDAALRLCLRGLERHPTNVEAHALLARLYLETGDRQRASDEWATVLRLEPENFAAHRGLGFDYIEKGDLGAARRHLEYAGYHRPNDSATREALALLRELEARRAEADPAPTVIEDGAGSSLPADPAARHAEAASPERRDPTRIFDALRSDDPFLGAVLLDAQGHVIAGAFDEDPDSAQALGAFVDDAIGEARRAAELLGLGAWRGMLMETAESTLHVLPLESDTTALVLARRGAPAGWVLRTAERVAELGRAFMETSA